MPYPTEYVRCPCCNDLKSVSEVTIKRIICAPTVEQSSIQFKCSCCDIQMTSKVYFDAATTAQFKVTNY